MFGKERLKTLITAIMGDSADEMIDAICGALAAFTWVGGWCVRGGKKEVEDGVCEVPAAHPMRSEVPT